MKTKLLVLTFVLGVIVSFSFISIDQSNNKIDENEMSVEVTNQPMDGFALEDENQF